MPRQRLLLAALILLVLFVVPFARGEDVVPLPGTEPLIGTDDIASRLVDTAHQFLLGELEKSIDGRAAYWHRDFSSADAYTASIKPQRERLAHILGVRDARVPFEAIEFVATTSEPPLVGESERWKAYAVRRWPTLVDLHGEGLLLVPRDADVKADVIAIPDADQTPEMIAGLVPGVAGESQFARRLADSGCRVLIPVLIDRHYDARNGRAKMTSREFIYRSAYELGRHLIGYEVQKVLAGVDWFERDGAQRGSTRPVGVFGYGEGGMLALYAGALDERIASVCVSGYFDSRQNIWQQPIDRNVFGLLEQFGDAELATMVLPRKIVVEACQGPELTLPSEGGAPAELKSPQLEVVSNEVDRALALMKQAGPLADLKLIAYGGDHKPGTAGALDAFLAPLNVAKLQPLTADPQHLRKAFDPQHRQQQQMHEMDRYNQAVLLESPYTRQEFMNKLDTSSVEKYKETVEPYRQFFRNEVVGHYPYDLINPNPHTRKAYETEKWTGYEVVLDVFPGLFAYGVLLLPKDLAPDEKRPVVVCQHGLEGRPQDVIQGDNPAYHDFAAKLAEQGFITFAPQNLYIFRDRFRTLQRMSYPIKRTLFSMIVPQHQQIVNWLSTLPNVDPQRIAFYGLSYGGKSAMRIPPLVPNYCLSICSADFNEWVWKNASTRSNYSYVWTGEYEIFEFDLGSTFNYAEMAALIAPRPFMVERGHYDGVSCDEAVSYEFAKVRFLYQGRLKLKDQCEMEVFDGPHTINGQGTYAFLHKHLNWPEKN